MRIKTVAMLYYMCEFAKFFIQMAKQPLDIRNVIIDKELERTPYWWYFYVAQKEGWLIGNEEIKETRREINFYNYHFGQVDTENLPTIAGLENCVPNIDYEFSKENGYTFTYQVEYAKYNPELMLVSLMAYLKVSDLVANRSNVYRFKINAAELSAFTMLAGLREQLTESLILETEQQNIVELEWLAWKNERKCRNYRINDTTSKLEYLIYRDIEIGDLVVLFGQKNNTIETKARHIVNSLISCEFAIIRGITETQITLDIIKNLRLKEDVDNEYRVLHGKIKKFISRDTFNTTKVIQRVFDLTDIGISYMTEHEQYFIETLDKTEDIVPIYLEKYWGQYVMGTVYVTQEEFLYRVLKEHEIDFNLNRFYKICEEKGVLKEKATWFTAIPQRIYGNYMTFDVYEDGQVVENVNDTNNGTGKMPKLYLGGRFV